MRFSPTKLLHGLLYAAPVLLLTLAACGGGGPGSTPPAPLAAAYTVGGTVTGLTGSNLVLRNNGGDDKTISTNGSYTFATSVANGGSYNVSVLTHPSAPVQVCTLTNASGSIASANVTNANVSCATAYTISGTISGDSAIAVSGIGPILRNNGGDDLFIPTLPPSGGSVGFIFSTPVASGQTYAVTQLSRAKSPGQTCDGTTLGSTIMPAASGVVSSNVILTITCVSAPIVPRFAYATNSTDNTVSAYTIAASGVLAASTTPTTTTGTEPYSVSVDPSGRFAYVVNRSANNISAYNIDYINGTGALTPTDTNGAVSGTQYTIAAGTYPVSVTVHPSGKFAYVANQSSNSISVYSINSTGALSAIDANGAAGTQASIATGTTPYAVTIDPTGYFAYVANYGSNTISAYSINQTSGALTAFGAPVTTGTGPSSIAIDPYDKFLLVTNTVSGEVISYTIANGALTLPQATATSSFAPRSVAIDPSPGLYAYVANANKITVSAYTISQTTGALAPVGTYTAGATPVSVNVDPSGQFVYVANFGTVDSSGVTVIPGSVSAYSIGTGGALIELTGSPFATATGSNSTSVTTTQ